MATSLDQSDYHKMALRLPRELREWLAEFAEREGVSINSAIVQILDGRRLSAPPMNLTQEALDAIRDIVRHETKHK